MQQTTGKYKLNLIDTSDPFSPDALNKNTEAIEAALLEHKSETDAALEANKVELQTTIAAVEKGASLYHLAGPVDNSTDKAAFTVDLSGIDMSKYRALFMLAVCDSGAKVSCSAAKFSVTPYSSSTYPKLTTMIWVVNTLSGIRVYSGGSTTSFSSVHNAEDVTITNAVWENINYLDCTKGVVFLDVYGLKA